MCSFWRTKQEIAEKRQNSLKLSRTAFFCLIVNQYPIEIDQITSNWKLVIRKKEN